jgi:hypothetical protein
VPVQPPQGDARLHHLAPLPEHVLALLCVQPAEKIVEIGISPIVPVELAVVAAEQRLAEEEGCVLPVWEETVEAARPRLVRQGKGALLQQRIDPSLAVG